MWQGSCFLISIMPDYIADRVALFQTNRVHIHSDSEDDVLDRFTIKLAAARTSLIQQHTHVMCIIA